MQSSHSKFQEVVEAEGHLIDSHIMEQIFDTVIEFNGHFTVQHFSIGKTNAEPSRLRLRVETVTQETLDRLLARLLELGCAPAEGQEAQWRTVERDRCAPEDFYSTTNHRTLVRRDGTWHQVRNQRMDALIVWEDGSPVCRKLRDVKAGNEVVTGMRGIRVVPEPKERDRLAFAFMSNGISSERQVETAVRQTAALMRQIRGAKQSIVVVAGPVVVHTGGATALASMIRGEFMSAPSTTASEGSGTRPNCCRAKPPFIALS